MLSDTRITGMLYTRSLLGLMNAVQASHTWVVAPAVSSCNPSICCVKQILQVVTTDCVHVSPLLEFFGFQISVMKQYVWLGFSVAVVLPC